VSDPRELDRIRRELQRLGYLSHRIDRLLLSDALAPRRPFRGLVTLAGKIGVLAGSVLAAVSALALAAANGAPPGSPFDLLPLFLHLWLPLAVSSALGFLVVAGLFRAAVGAVPPRRLEALRVGAALAATGLLALVALVRGWELLVALPRWQRALAGLALPLATAALAKLVADGLLAVEVMLARWTPGERAVSRRTLAAGLVASLGGLALIALLLPRDGEASAPAALPVAPGERVLLVGVDGVLADELDYLLARGDLPTLARLTREGGVVASYRRPTGLAPAAFWTSVATGLPPAQHGVVALDSYRPLGVATPLARSGPWRLWWETVELPLGLAEYRPLLANRRRAPAVWELAARGGAPIAAIDWWATFPAEPLPGWVVAHGAFQLLAGGAAGAVEPAELRAPAAELARGIDAGPFAAPLVAALPPMAAREALERAILPDRFYREVARRAQSLRPKVTALYLPALDIVAEGWLGGDVSLADLVRVQLVEVDTLITELAPGVGTVVVVLDPGRRGGDDEGRVLIWRERCPGATLPAVDPLALAAGLLRATGLPQSRQLPQPPAVCSWPAAFSTVDAFGDRALPRGPAGSGEEYLDSLRSLGYL
jgi:hypothetical protein